MLEQLVNPVLHCQVEGDDADEHRAVRQTTFSRCITIKTTHWQYLQNLFE